jgi:hypothetical protein
MRPSWAVMAWLPLLLLTACVASQPGHPRPYGLLHVRSGLNALPWIGS